MGERTAIVVGGGIGGLATAIALHGRGWRVRVLERAPEFTEVGAGISLWPNALRALDAIGVGDRVRALGGQELNGGIRHRSGRWLARTNGVELARRFGPAIILHRADLLRALLEAVPAEALAAGATVSSVSTSDSGSGSGSVSASVDVGGTTVTADLVVGADGLRSVVRQSLWPSAKGPRYAGYPAWRFVTAEPVEEIGEACESWGPGTRFGYAPLPDGRVYCYATANRPEGSISDSDLVGLFGDWHDPIPRLLVAAAPGSVLHHDLYDLPDLPSFVRGRVALLGDAAHAMTPNLGQGACQALEDAATLAAVLDSEPDVPSALAAYDSARRRRTQGIVRLSRRAGALGQWQAPAAVAVRDRVMSLIPESAMTRSLAPILSWDCP